MISNIPYEDKDFEKAFDTDDNTHTKIDLGKYRVYRVSYIATDNPAEIKTIVKTRDTADSLGIELYDPSFNCYLVIAYIKWSEEDQCAKINAIDQRLSTAIAEAKAYVIDTVDLYYAINRTLAYINHRHNKEYSYQSGITASDMFNFLDHLGYPPPIDISKLTQQLANNSSSDLVNNQTSETFTLQEVTDIVEQLIADNLLVVNYMQFSQKGFNAFLNGQNMVAWSELISQLSKNIKE